MSYLLVEVGNLIIHFDAHPKGTNLAIDMIYAVALLVWVVKR
jgi:hypothetical protein